MRFETVLMVQQIQQRFHICTPGCMRERDGLRPLRAALGGVTALTATSVCLDLLRQRSIDTFATACVTRRSEAAKWVER